VDLNDPSINTITLRRSRRLNNKTKQSFSHPIPIRKTYPLRSRLRHTNNPIPTATNHRSHSIRQEYLLSSMGLRNGKIVNLRSIISGSTSPPAQDISTSSLPLLSFNPLPIHHQPTLSYSSTNTNNNNNNTNNNNNNNDFNSLFYYLNLTNHPSLDPSKYFPIRLDILLDRPAVTRDKQIEYGWNHEDRSMNIFVKHNDPCTFHRHVR
jgi:hypothetical protein